MHCHCTCAIIFLSSRVIGASVGSISVAVSTSVELSNPSSCAPRSVRAEQRGRKSAGSNTHACLHLSLLAVRRVRHRIFDHFTELQPLRHRLEHHLHQGPSISATLCRLAPLYPWLCVHSLHHLPNLWFGLRFVGLAFPLRGGAGVLGMYRGIASRQRQLQHLPVVSHRPVSDLLHKEGIDQHEVIIRPW